MRTAEPGMHVPSTRGRKRKNPLQPSAWDPASAARSNMPRASGMPGQQTPIVKRPYYNLVFGTEQDEDVADSLVDTLDVITPRDLAAARYAQNHELLEKVFGPHRMDAMQPPTSPYAHTSKKQLEEQLAPIDAEIAAMQEAHKERLAALQAESRPDDEEGGEAWEQAPSQGKILGIGHIRTPPSPEIAAQLAARREAAPPAEPDATTTASIAQINEAHGVEAPAEPAPPAAPQEATEGES